jgi:hypothetical protein
MLANIDGKCWQMLLAIMVHQWNDEMESISIVCMFDYESHQIGSIACVLLSEIGMRKNIFHKCITVKIIILRL